MAQPKGDNEMFTEDFDLIDRFFPISQRQARSRGYFHVTNNGGKTSKDCQPQSVINSDEAARKYGGVVYLRYYYHVRTNNMMKGKPKL